MTFIESHGSVANNAGLMALCCGPQFYYWHGNSYLHGCPGAVHHPVLAHTFLQQVLSDSTATDHIVKELAAAFFEILCLSASCAIHMRPVSLLVVTASRIKPAIFLKLAMC